MRRLAILIVLSVLALKSELLPIRTYTTADGLASDRVDCIVPDSRGFLWFCTAEGISIFDGSNFTNFTVRDGLPNRLVHDMVESSTGDYWLATDGGLSRFRPAAGPGGIYVVFLMHCSVPEIDA